MQTLIVWIPKHLMKEILVVVIVSFSVFFPASANAEVLDKHVMPSGLNAMEFSVGQGCRIRVYNAFADQGLRLSIRNTGTQFANKSEEAAILSVSTLSQEAKEENPALKASLIPCSKCVRPILEECFPNTLISKIFIYSSKTPHTDMTDTRHYAGFGVCVQGSPEEVRYIARGLWRPVFTKEALVNDACK